MYCNIPSISGDIEGVRGATAIRPPSYTQELNTHLHDLTEAIDQKDPERKKQAIYKIRKAEGYHA